METYKQYKWWLKALSGADEVQARRFVGAIALEIGWGGITKVEELTGMSHSTIKKGIEELKTSEKLEPPERLRVSGGGRKKVEEKDPGILNDLEKIMDENTSGDPMSLLKWTNKSTYKIADELRKLQHKIDPDTVGRLLKENDYSLQANKKNIEGSSVPERDAQFRYINEQAKEFINKEYPVISVDAKKKENVGNFRNSGRTWIKKGQAKEVNVYDFPSLGVGRATPYGIYDLKRNEGMVNVGISYDTSEFAVESIRQWWLMFGRNNYPNVKGLMICADGGGSNGSRNKGWKFYLQELVNQIKIPITVCHYPPGTSKWNKIEHCMFSYITMNWKGKPLVSYETIIKLISGTKTKKGLTVASRLDEKEYTKGVKILDEEMEKLQIEYHSLHPKWNYSISPKRD
ncbi:MAG: ISAzo13 family transposase [Candidatus Methanoperedens sp.]|nr:ISAzo13 family transposase [Candidatus Methanoperedens sp.]